MMTTFASLNCRASSSPIPLVPPVIRIVRPASRIFARSYTHFRYREISDKHLRIDRRHPMVTYLPDRECSAEIDPRVEALVTDLIGCVADKWTMLILEALTERGELRFTQLAKSIP